MSFGTRQWLEVGTWVSRQYTQSTKVHPNSLWHGQAVLCEDAYIEGKCVWQEGLVPGRHVFLVSSGENSRVGLTPVSPSPRSALLEKLGLFGSSVWWLHSYVHNVCFPYWDSLAFYPIISTPGLVLTLSFQNSLQVFACFRPFLQISGSAGFYSHFAGFPRILPVNVPKSLIRLCLI